MGGIAHRTVKSLKYKRYLVVFKIKDLNQKQISRCISPIPYLIYNSQPFQRLPRDGSVIYFRFRSFILNTTTCRFYCSVGCPSSPYVQLQSTREGEYIRHEQFLCEIIQLKQCRVSFLFYPHGPFFLNCINLIYSLFLQLILKQSMLHQHALFNYC